MAVITIAEPENAGAFPVAAEPIAGRWTASLIYALVVLTMVYCFAFVDRQVLNLLVGPIKKDFGATDQQIGYVLGPAFIFSYAALGLPAGWCADRFNRRNLVFIAGLIWGAGTMAAALVNNYHALFLTRMVVGGSEAFLFPAGMSMIADMFDRKRLPIATSVFLASPYIGGGLALISGGLVLDVTEKMPLVSIPLLGLVRGWQATFVVIGLIGLIPILLLPTIKEAPRHRRLATQGAEAVDRRFGFVEGCAYMAVRWRFYVAFFFGAACSSLVLTTVSAWAPTFLTRSFGMTPGVIGVRYGTLVLLFGLAGGILSPVINAWLARRYPDSTMRTVRLGPIMLALSAVLLWFSHTQGMALFSLALLTFAYSFPLSMAGTSLQLAAPPRLRGLASAFYFVIVSLIGHGAGPTIVPLVTNHIFHDEQQVGPALAIVAFVFGILAFILLSVAMKGFQIERGLRPGPGQSAGTQE